MGCDDVKERLSEYVDDLLDGEAGAELEEHLSTCTACQQELASLRALVHELGSLRPVEPPADFLEQLHERLEQRSWVSRILRILFVPMGTKVPLQLAGALAVAILVISVFYVQQEEMKTTEAPVSLQQRGLSEMEAIQADKVRQEGTAMSKPALKTAGETKGGRTPVELDLLLKKRPSRRSLAPQPAVDEAGGIQKEKRQTMAASEAFRDAEDREGNKLTEPLPGLTDLITHAKGKVLDIEYHKDTKTPSLIRAEIPAQAFDSFYEKLRELGDVSSPSEIPPDNSQEIIQLEVRILP